MAGPGQQNDEYLLQFTLCFGFGNDGRAGGSAEGMHGIRHKLGRHICGRKHIVHQAGVDGAAGHAVIFRGFGVLGHGHPPFPLDRPQPQRAVTAGAGKHDADGQLVLILRQRAEEEIDGKPQATR